MPFTVVPTGEEKLDRVQRNIADAFQVLEAQITQALMALSNATAIPPSGVLPGTYAPPASITVDVNGVVTKIL